MEAFSRVFAVIVLMVAVLAGGCSTLVFGTLVKDWLGGTWDSQYGSLLLWGSGAGFLIALFCYGTYRAVRPKNKPSTKPPSDSDR